MISKKQLVVFSFALCGMLGVAQYLISGPDAGVGADFVAAMRRMLKDPFLSLLSSSEYATKEEVSDRTSKAMDALNSFKATLPSAQQVDQTVSVQPAPTVSFQEPAVPATAPVEQQTQTAPQPIVQEAASIPVEPVSQSAPVVEAAPAIILPQPADVVAPQLPQPDVQPAVIAPIQIEQAPAVVEPAVQQPDAATISLPVPVAQEASMPAADQAPAQPVDGGMPLA